MMRIASLPRLLPRIIAFIACVVGVLLAGPTLHAQLKPAKQLFTRKNTFGFFFAYSNDSSHILLGYAQNRKLLNIGASYSRRIWAGRVVNWQYNGEIMPVALESDPVDHNVDTISPNLGIFGNNFGSFNSEPIGPCVPASYQLPPITIQGGTYTVTQTVTCTRRWVIGEGMMPVGFQWSFLPRHRLQPYLIGHGGYMYSTQPIPTQDAGNFNFVFDFGAGFEMFRSRTQSIRVDYRYHHISNHNTASENPGIDSGLAQITYSFGR